MTQPVIVEQELKGLDNTTATTYSIMSAPDVAGFLHSTAETCVNDASCIVCNENTFEIEELEKTSREVKMKKDIQTLRETLAGEKEAGKANSLTRH